ncbi:hypothetical protein [Burkholderia ambifaria]|uniref:hypothetical protein n=1 Tax=Burkholderia ambifaria TaxID=152480 RepID=UPI001589D6B1|nr:hypothetical protein [Burkholderia ambifaria]
MAADGELAVRIVASSSITTGRRASADRRGRAGSTGRWTDSRVCEEKTGSHAYMNQMNVCIHDVSFGSALIAGIDRTTCVSQIGRTKIFVPASGAADEGEHENVAAHGALDGDRLIESNAA